MTSEHSDFEYWKKRIRDECKLLVEESQKCE